MKLNIESVNSQELISNYLKTYKIINNKELWK